MFLPQLLDLESTFYRTVNLFLKPFIKAGFTSLGFVPAGAILVETKGRKSGKIRNVPLLVTHFGEFILVGTIRGQQSQWVKNLAANPDVRYWWSGRPHKAKAHLFARGVRRPEASELPPLARTVASTLEPLSNFVGGVFAILTPDARCETSQAA